MPASTFYHEGNKPGLDLHLSPLSSFLLYLLFHFIFILLHQTLAFVAWALFTFLSHSTAKTFLQQTSSTPGLLPRLLLLTTLQMTAGAFLYLLLVLFRRLPSFGLDHTALLLGATHALGMLMTNASMSQAPASLTHLVKMSEPLCTSFLAAIQGAISFNPMILPVMSVVLLTAMGSEPWAEVEGSSLGILLALASNSCYATRNTLTKFTGDGTQEQSRTTVSSFASMSLGGLITLVPLLLISFLLGPQEFSIALSSLKTSPLLLISSSICHLVYNLISVTVILAIFDPIQHSPLNVGKRTSIVVAFYLFSQRPYSLVNLISTLICLISSVLGARALKPKEASGVTKNISQTHKWKVLLPLLIICGTPIEPPRHKLDPDPRLVGSGNLSHGLVEFISPTNTAKELVVGQ